MLIQIKSSKLSDDELQYLHQVFAQAAITLCEIHQLNKDGEYQCPCKASTVCNALQACIRYLEKQAHPQFCNE